MVLHSTAVRRELSDQCPPGPTGSIVRRLGTQSLIALLGNGFTLLVGLPLQIYVARNLGIEGLGVFTLIEAGVVTVGGLLSFGIGQTLMRFIPAHMERAEFDNIRTLVTFGGLILFGIGALGYLATLVSLAWVGMLWPEVAAFKGAVVLMGLMIPLGLLLNFLQQGLRGFQEIRYMVIGSSVVQLSTKAALAVAVFSLGFGLNGYIGAVLFAALTAVAWMGFGLARKVRALPRGNAGAPSAGREWRRYAATVYAQGLLSSAVAPLDRFLLGAFAGSGAVGIYAVARQLQHLPLVFHQMLLMVGAPMFSATHARGNAAERAHLFHLMTDWAVRISLPLVLFLMLSATPVLGLYGADFAADGAVILIVLVVAQLTNLAFGPVGYILLMSGLERTSLRISVVNSVLLAAVMILIIPPLGLTGVAVAMLASTVFANVSSLIVVRRSLDLHWWDRRFLRWLAPGVVTGAFMAMVAGSGVATEPVALGTVLVAGYVAFLAVSVLQGLHEDDRTLLRRIGEVALRRAPAA